MGVGYGSASCGDHCSQLGGPAGDLALRARLSDKLLLSGGIAGWTKSEGGLTMMIGTLGPRLVFCADPAFGFFFSGGLGLGFFRLSDSETSHTEIGRGLLFGAGYHARLGGGVSLTPFANIFDVRTSEPRSTVAQIGVAVTIP